MAFWTGVGTESRMLLRMGPRHSAVVNPTLSDDAAKDGAPGYGRRFQGARHSLLSHSLPLALTLIQLLRA
jgi:hypothetical protein